MSKPIFKARVISTGKKVEVYKHTNGNYIDWSDCNTEYKKDDIEILNQINERQSN